MIKNEKELIAAQEQFVGWEKSFEVMKERLSPDSFRIYREVHEPIVLDIQKEINEYKALKHDRDEVAYFTNPMEIGRWIIGQRIKKGITQSKFGEKLHLSQAQISRDEDIEYRTSPLMRIYEVIKIFGYAVIEVAFFKNKAEMANFHILKSTELQMNEFLSTSSTNLTAINFGHYAVKLNSNVGSAMQETVNG